MTENPTSGRPDQHIRTVVNSDVDNRTHPSADTAKKNPDITGNRKEEQILRPTTADQIPGGVLFVSPRVKGTDRVTTAPLGKKTADSLLTNGTSPTVGSERPSASSKRRHKTAAERIKITPDQHRAFEKAYSEHNRALMVATMRQFGAQLDPHTIQDIVAETWARAAENWGNIGQGATLRAWLNIVSQNQAKDLLRKSNRHAEIPIDPRTDAVGDIPDNGIPVDDAAIEAVNPLHRKLANKLSPPNVKSLIAVYVYELTHRENAFQEGVPTDTSKSRTYRGKNHLLALAGVTEEEEEDTYAGAQKVRDYLASLR